ncbi:uncharacterized protein LOC121516728 [Cheilinus undulatus]|uniref:uncharacterized protein LOC121516728 n=1 Tax=Cheilinus undulatus TaxID=241271 RepID=UPI001BD6501A|nr:uncharacterized protein LOC121516728 [Cheilinus undulatus]
MTMLAVLALLLMLGLSRSTVNKKIEIKTVRVGDDVKLTCPRESSTPSPVQLFWFRQVSGDLPEFLGGAYSFDSDIVNKTPHTTLKQEPGTFVLIINQTQLSDTGLYFCVKGDVLYMTLLKGVFLRTEGPESDITTIIEDLSPDPDHPDLMTLQCSVLSDSETKTCPGNHNVFWFRSGSDEAHPSVIYTHGNRRDECEESPETQSPQKCVYSFSKTVSSSDAETYYCAVATCGQMLFGHGTEITTKGDKTALFMVSSALALSLILNAVLIYSIKTKSSVFGKAADALTTNAAAASAAQQGQQGAEASLIYCAPAFSKKRTGKRERRNVKAAEEETVYSGIRAAVTA